MREADIKSLLKDVVSPNLKFQKVNGWVMLPCPLARWTHEKGKDSNPSFGVRIDNEEASGFNCFTCKEKGPLSYFLKLMEEFTGENHAKLIRSLENDEAYQAELPDWDACRTSNAQQKPEPLPDHYIDLYDPLDYLHPYLASRGIDDLQSVASAKLLVDYDDGHGAERILFPVMGTQGELYGFTGRAVEDDVIPKARDYLGLPKKATVLGAHRLPNYNYVIVVEGLFDYLVGVSYGLPAVAVMHSGMTQAQADIIKEVGHPVFLLYDNDLAGREGTKTAAALLRDFVPTSACRYPVYENEDPPADPADMWENEWLRAMEEAELK